MILQLTRIETLNHSANKLVQILRFQHGTPARKENAEQRATMKGGGEISTSLFALTTSITERINVRTGECGSSRLRACRSLSRGGAEMAFPQQSCCKITS